MPTPRTYRTGEVAPYSGTYMRADYVLIEVKRGERFPIGREHTKATYTLAERRAYVRIKRERKGK